MSIILLSSILNENKETDMFSTLYKESPSELKNIVDKTKKIEQNPIWHPEIYVYDHIKTVTNRLYNCYNDINLSICGYFHDLGKVYTTEWDDKKRSWSSNKHELFSTKILKEFKDFILEIGGNIDIIEFVVLNHMKIKYMKDSRTIEKAKLFNNKYIDYLLKFTTADYGGTQMGCKESDEIEKMKKEVEVYNKKIEEKEKLYSIFNGNDLIDLFPSFKGTKNMGIYLKFAHDYIKERNFKVTKKDVKDYIISIKESNESISYKDYKNFCDKIDNYMVGINPLGDRKEIIDFFKKFPDHDKNFYRIYFDLKVDRDDWKIEIPKEIKDFMGWYRFPIVDYEKGLTKDKYGRVVKFSKIFKQMGQDNLIKTYADSKTDTLKDTNDLQVVISRHIYDIIGSSTNRGWTTCIDLYDKRYQGRHLKELIYLIGNGVIIAYLIRKKDRNIENPISRCFIKKVNNELRVDSVYGTNVKEFTKFLDEWVKKYNSYISKK